LKFVDKIPPHIRCSVTFFENHALYKKIWKNTVERDRPQMIVWGMGISYWIPKATNKPSEYVTLKAFPLQQRLN